MALLKHIGTDRAHVAGHSMGGHVALELALRHPELVASCTLIGAGSGQTNKEGFRKMCIKKAEEIEAKGLAALSEYARGRARRRHEMKNPESYARSPH